METNEIIQGSVSHFGSLNSQEVEVVAIGLVIIFIWLLSMVIILCLMMRQYTFSENNKYVNETMGLPIGTLRGMLTLTLLIVFVIAISMSMLVESFTGRFDALLNAFEVMLAFYFGSKVMRDVTENDKQKSIRKMDVQREIAQVEAEAKIVSKKGQGSSEADFFTPGAAG